MNKVAEFSNSFLDNRRHPASPGVSIDADPFSSTPEQSTSQRYSRGLGYCLSSLPDAERSQVLDLGGLSESNVSFLSSLGCRIHALDLLSLFDAYREKLPGRRFGPADAKAFIKEYLGYPPAAFDVILVWDVLEFLDTEVLKLAVSRFGRILHPGGSLLTFFHTQSKGVPVTAHQYQIKDAAQLRLRERHRRPLSHTFNNRSLERLFGGFGSLKFFLTHDSIREVIVIR